MSYNAPELLLVGVAETLVLGEFPSGSDIGLCKTDYDLTSSIDELW